MDEKQDSARAPDSVLGADHSRANAGDIWRAAEEQWRQERIEAGLPVEPQT